MAVLKDVGTEVLKEVAFFGKAKESVVGGPRGARAGLEEFGG